MYRRLAPERAKDSDLAAQLLEVHGLPSDPKTQIGAAGEAGVCRFACLVLLYRHRGRDGFRCALVMNGFVLQVMGC